MSFECSQQNNKVVKTWTCSLKTFCKHCWWFVARSQVPTWEPVSVTSVGGLPLVQAGNPGLWLVHCEGITLTLRHWVRSSSPTSGSPQQEEFWAKPKQTWRGHWTKCTLRQEKWNHHLSPNSSLCGFLIHCQMSWMSWWQKLHQWSRSDVKWLH